jgi:hypothetical protein
VRNVLYKLRNNKTPHGFAVMAIALDEFYIRAVVILAQIRTIQPAAKHTPSRVVAVRG